MDEELLHDRSNLDRLATLQNILANTENELQSAERRYHSFIKNSSEGIWRFELERPIPTNLPVEKQIRMLYESGYMAECNDAFAQQYGYDSGSEMVGSRLAEMLPDDPPSWETLKIFIEHDYDLNLLESTEVDRYGNEKHFLNSLKGECIGGKLQRVWATQIDITDRVKLEHQLAYQIELYEAIMDHVMDIIKIQDTSGLIKYASPSHLEALHYTPAELIGHNVREFVHPEDLEVMEGVLKTAVEGGASEIVSFRMRRKDGRWIKVEGMARGIHEGNKVTTVLSIAWRSRLRQFRQQLNKENGEDE